VVGVFVFSYFYFGDCIFCNGDDGNWFLHQKEEVIFF